MLAMVLSLTPTSLALGLPVHLFHFLHIQRHVQGNNLNIQDSFLAGSGHSLSGHLLHVHRLLLQANHLLPLQYSPALSLRVDGDSAVHWDIMAYQQLDKLVASCFRLCLTLGLGTTPNTISPKPPPNPLKVLPPLSCHATQKYTQRYLPSAFYYSDLCRCMKYLLSVPTHRTKHLLCYHL